MKKGLAGFSLIMIMIFNFVYMYDLGGSSTKPLSDVTINNLQGNELQDLDSTIQSKDVTIHSKTSDIPVGWSYQKVINLNPSTPSTDYNVKVILDPTNFDYTKALSNGADIRFTDLSDNPLSYWIETWNQGGKSIIWVKIPTTGTDSFYMNYGNPSALSESNGDATFLFFDDFPGTSINPAKWTTETDTYSTMSVSGGIVSLSSNTPNDWAPSVHLGFSDFYVLHGQDYGAIGRNGITLGRPYGPSNILFTRNITTGMAQTDNVYNYEEWYTTDIRWISNSLAQFNNGTHIVTHTNSSTIPTTPLQVRILTMDMYAGPSLGTWFGQAIQSIGTWGSGHAIRARSWHDGVGPPEIRCDWVFVRKCTQFEPAATVVNDDLTITSPQAKNYAAAMKGHYPASYSFENDPSFPYSKVVIGGHAPSGWDAYYSGWISVLRVIDDFLGYKKVVEIRGHNNWPSSGIGKDFPSSATSGTIEFWHAKDTDSGKDGTLFTISGVGGSIQFTIEDGSLRNGIYPGTVVASNVFPNNTWIHIRVDFDITQGWQIQLNDTWYGTGYALPFVGSPTDISRFDIRTHHNTESGVVEDQYVYLDAVGYSWDSSYIIGDNLQEGLLVNFEHPTIAKSEWEGYYPATDGFDDQITGLQPPNWFTVVGGTGTDGSGLSQTVVDTKIDADGNVHKKVLKGADSSSGGILNANGFFNDAITSGTLEFWSLREITGTNYGYSFGTSRANDYFGRWIVHLIDLNTLYYYDGNTSVNTGVPLTQNKWYRYSIDFSDDGTYAGLAAHQYRVRLYDSDGVTLLYASPDASFSYNGDTDAFIYVSGQSLLANLFWDAIGFSWDPNYSIGDNRFPAVYEGPELADVSWIGYSLDGQPNVTISGATTIPMPLTGTHSLQLYLMDSYGYRYSSPLQSFAIGTLSLVTPESKIYAQPMSGYYPGTVGFEDVVHATTGLALEFIDEYYTAGSFGGIGVHDGPIYGHNKVLHIGDAQDAYYTYGVHNFDNPQTAGLIEFWNLVDNIHMPSGANYFYLRASDDTIAIQMRINVVGTELSNIEYFDGVSWQLISDQVSYKWYHHSISFDCEAGVNGQFSWKISFENGTEVDRVENIEFLNDLNTLDEIYMASDVPTYFGATRWDAFGFSWEGYSVGDNLNEGLLISYEPPTPLDWTAYSLDGGPNVTIQGNHTIPLPSVGTHSIQVVGFDSLGIYYRSDVRVFEVIPPTPPSITGPSDFSIYFGATGYSILWTVTDAYPANYTVFRNGTIHDTGTWTDSVIIWLDGLVEGRHNFTCVVENTYQKISSDEVWITVLPATPDITPPTISSPADITFEEGSIGYGITWIGSDLHPWWSSVWKNGSLIYDQSWTPLSDEITINLADLSKGNYNYTCTLFDEASNSVTDTVWVTVLEAVPDTDAPIIIPPLPITMEEGDPGHSLFWYCSDAHPFAYQILVNETGFPGHEYKPWHGENVSISLDDLNVGIWVFNLTLWDLSGNSSSTEVIVTVIPEAPDTDTPYASTPAELIITENMPGTIIWEVSDKYPGNYVINQNGTQIYAQDHWDSGIIQYHFTSLPLGTWYFELILWDEAENSFSSTAIVKVLPGSEYDTNPPEISHVADQTFDYGSTGINVIIYLFDEHPQGYSVFISTVTPDPIESSWTITNIQVELSFDGLAIGSYTVTITAWDVFANSASQTFLVKVTGDNTPPDITPHPDITAYSNTTVKITWEVTDDKSPSHYELINLTTGDVLTSGAWSGSQIQVELNNVPVGTYDLQLRAYDSSGNYAIDDVTLTIIKSKTTPGFELFSVLSLLLVLIIYRKGATCKRRIKK